VLNQESTALSWVATEEVTELPLHPGFAASWRLLSARL
jgi:8-oxo-dGTP diphosphatase